MDSQDSKSNSFMAAVLPPSAIYCAVSKDTSLFAFASMFILLCWWIFSQISAIFSAPTKEVEVQNAIEEQAKYFPLDTEADVDRFWDATGLRQQEMRRQLNEKMVNDYNSFVANVDESVEANLGYDPYLIRQTELWLQNEEF